MYAKNAGKSGVAIVAWMNAIFKDNSTAKAMFFDKNSRLFKDNWNITTRNW
jgi:hypothetical protein